MVWSFYCSGTLDESVVLGIFVASLRAVGCAATLAAAGLWLARRGLMSPSLSKGLSQLSVKLAIPALLFSSMVPGISFELLGYAWPLLLLPAVYLLLGLLIGGLMLLLVRPPADFRLSTVAACTFGNTTGIPVVLLSVIGSFQLFELPFVLLNNTAGPDNRGLTVVMYLYQTGFEVGDLGYASAIGWSLAILLMILAVGLRLVLRRYED